jgi:Protein of unknown function (DUF2568)
VGAANLGLRFLLELALLGAVGYWGFSEFDGVGSVLVGLGAPLLVAAVWGTFMSPKAARPTRDPARIVLEIVLFGAGVAALVEADATTAAIVFAVLTLLHLALTFPLRQRSPEATGA